MTTLHENCGGIIIRWGKRRRRCALCLKTWSAWKRKRGRKQKRIHKSLSRKYVEREMLSISIAARQRKQSEFQLQRALKKSRDHFLRKTPWPNISNIQPLIAIADALMVHIEKQIYSIHLILLRPVNGNRAIITKPYIQEGKESVDGWRRAFHALSPKLRRQIVALVSDGHRGLYSAGRRNKWRAQFCIFHAIARMQGRRSRWAYSRHREEGIKIYKNLKIVLTSKYRNEVLSALAELKLLGFQTNSPQLRKHLAGFINNYRLYRTYIIHPELNLPRTSNSAESLIRMIRALLSRAHGFRTKNSITRWIEVLLKSKKTIACNGFHQQN